MTRSSPKVPTPEAAPDQATEDLEISNGQVQKNVIDDGNRDDKKETVESVTVNTESPPPPTEQPVFPDAKAKITESEDPPSQLDVVVTPPTDGTAATEFPAPQVPVSSK